MALNRDKYRVNRAYLNQFRNTAQNDPMFALGELLGRAYVDRYNERGTQKALEKAEAQYGDGTAPSQADRDNALKIIEAQNLAKANDTLGTSNTLSKDKQMQAVKDSLGVNTVQGRAMFGAMPLNNPNMIQGEGEFYDRLRASVQERQNQYDALKTVGAVPQTQYEIGNRILDNYVQASPVAQKMYADRMANFNAEDEKAKLIAQMEKDGRNAEQIDRVMATMDGRLQGMQDKAYRAKANNLMDELGSMSYQDPEYQKTIIELSKYDPAAAKLYATYGKSMWDTQNAQVAEQQKAQQKVNDKNAEVGLRFEQAKALGLSDKQATLYALNGRVPVRGMGGGSASDVGSGKVPSYMQGISNLFDQSASAIAQGNNDAAANLQDQIQTMIYDDGFRKNFSANEHAELLQMWNGLEAQRMMMLKEKGLPVDDAYLQDRIAQAGGYF